MNEKKQLLETLKKHRETYAMGFDSGYHIDQLIKSLEEELTDDE